MLSKKNERWPPRRYWTLCFDVAMSTSSPASSMSRSSRAVSKGAVLCRVVSSMVRSPVDRVAGGESSKSARGDEPASSALGAIGARGDPRRSGRGFRGQLGGRRLEKIERAAPGAIEDQLDRSDLDADAAGVFGAVERMIGQRQHRRKVEHAVMADHDADAHGGSDRPAVDFACGARKTRAGLLGDGHGPLARRIAQ